MTFELVAVASYFSEQMTDVWFVHGWVVKAVSER